MTSYFFFYLVTFFALHVYEQMAKKSREIPTTKNFIPILEYFVDSFCCWHEMFLIKSMKQLANKFDE